MAAKKIDFERPLTLAEVLASLEALGTEQTRKTWRRHGALGPSFGVLFGDMERVVKGLKRTKAPLGALTEALWVTGNQDARTLACKIHEPDEIKDETIATWVADCDNYGLTDAVAGLVGASSRCAAWAERLTPNPSEYPGRAGWRLVAHLAMTPEPDDARLGQWLAELTEALSVAPMAVPNRKRQAMYDALIAIGGCRESLRVQALASAERIGHLEIDHGDTGCKTPDAGPYIVKTMMHRAAKAARNGTTARSGKA